MPMRQEHGQKTYNTNDNPIEESRLTKGCDNGRPKTIRKKRETFH